MSNYPKTEKLYEEYKGKIISLINELNDRKFLKLHKTKCVG